MKKIIIGLMVLSILMLVGCSNIKYKEQMIDFEQEISNLESASQTHTDLSNEIQNKITATFETSEKTSDIEEMKLLATEMIGFAEEHISNDEKHILLLEEVNQKSKDLITFLENYNSQLVKTGVNVESKIKKIKATQYSSNTLRTQTIDHKNLAEKSKISIENSIKN